MQPSLKTQQAKILNLLAAARGGEVPLPQIQACAAQYNARILELRRLGYRIPEPRIEVVNGQRHTWYRLEPASTGKPQFEKTAPPETPDRLFRDDAPMRHRDDG